MSCQGNIWQRYYMSEIMENLKINISRSWKEIGNNRRRKIEQYGEIKQVLPEVRILKEE